MPKVVFCVPSLKGPTAPFVAALEASIPLIEVAGWDHGAVEERGCPYISAARSRMLRKAMTAEADVVVFIDYDVSWSPADLLKLIETPGDVVAGLYRFKKDDVEFMGAIYTDAQGYPNVNDDGTLQGERVPAGFLKVTKEAVDRFMGAYPELIYGPRYNPSVDLFNHGARDGLWWGEDYAFSRRWIECGGQIAIVPDLDLTHHSANQAYPGNYHQFLMRQPGGSEAPK